MKKSPYNGGHIFEAIEPLTEVIARVEAKRNDPNDPLAKHYADDRFYKRIYKEAAKRLSQNDMLTVDAAAARLSITVKEYEDKAARGEALLIEIEGKKAVPAWQFGKDGKIDELKLDAAREFVIEGNGYFKFMDYIRFMTTETQNIVSTLPEKKLCDIFKKAGLSEYKCILTVEATMNQLVDERGANPNFFDAFITHLNAAVTKGGWDSYGGLSRPFRDKYKIPGLTSDEEREEHIKKQAKPPKP